MQMMKKYRILFWPLYFVALVWLGIWFTRPLEGQVEPPDTEVYVRRFVVEEYPNIARLAWLQGTVQMEVHIDKSGNVSEATAVNDADPILAIWALSSVKQWTFGHPTSLPAKLTISFHYSFKGESVDLSGLTNISTKLPYEVNIRTKPPPENLE